MKQIMRDVLLLAGLLMGSAAQAGKVTYIYTDAQGTPVMESDAEGHITARFDYTPYGVPVQVLSGSPSGPGYTGHVNDPDTGFVYMQARYYDPATGRFLSSDPISLDQTNILSGNRYAYVGNRPIVLVDLDGRRGVGNRGGIDGECGSSLEISRACEFAVDTDSEPEGQSLSDEAYAVVNQLNVGNDAHVTLQAHARSTSPFIFTESWTDGDGTFFPGRPDIGDSLTRQIWEIKSIGSTNRADPQLWLYTAATGYSKGGLPSFFGSAATIKLPGLFAMYTYNYARPGVISYTYELNPNYRYQYMGKRVVAPESVLELIGGAIRAAASSPVMVP